MLSGVYQMSRDAGTKPCLPILPRSQFYSYNAHQAVMLCKQDFSTRLYCWVSFQTIYWRKKKTTVYFFLQKWSSIRIIIWATSQQTSKMACVPSKDRSAWASAQSDQSLCCPHEESLGPQLPIERPGKTLIRLLGCPGWSESSLGTQLFVGFVMRRLIYDFVSCSLAF